MLFAAPRSRRSSISVRAAASALADDKVLVTVAHQRTALRATPTEIPASTEPGVIQSAACGGGSGACYYSTTLSFRNDHTPLPMEFNPRKVFLQLFGHVIESVGQVTNLVPTLDVRALSQVATSNGTRGAQGVAMGLIIKRATRYPITTTASMAKE